MLVSFGDRFQNSHRFVGDFRADTVARQDREVENHAGLLYCESVYCGTAA